MIQDVIKQARKLKKLSKSDVAKASGMSADRYGRFEYSDGLIRPAELELVLKELGLDIGPASAKEQQAAIIDGIRKLNGLIS